MKRLLLIWAALLVSCGSGPPRLHGRVYAMTPLAGADARAAGCDSAGTTAGEGFAELVQAAGGLEAYLSAEPIRWVILLEGYRLQKTGEPQNFDLNWLAGVHLGGDRFQIDYDSYPGGDPDEGARQGFGKVALEEGGWVSGASQQLSLPALDAMGVLTLEQIQIEARILVGETGLAMRQGMLSGYIPRAGLPGDWRFDALRSQQGFMPCGEGQDCDAMSVCLAVDVDALPDELMQ